MAQVPWVLFRLLDYFRVQSIPELLQGFVHLNLISRLANYIIQRSGYWFFIGNPDGDAVEPLVCLSMTAPLRKHDQEGGG